MTINAAIARRNVMNYIIIKYKTIFNEIENASNIGEFKIYAKIDKQDHNTFVETMDDLSFMVSWDDDNLYTIKWIQL